MIKKSRLKKNVSEKIKILRITSVPGTFKILGKQMKHILPDHDVYAMCSDESSLHVIAAIPELKYVPLKFIKRNINIIYDILALFEIYYKIKKIKPDIVHSHTPKAGLLAMVAAKFAGVKYRMHTVAGLVYESKGGWKKKVLKWTDQLCYRNASLIYPNSFSLMKILIEKEGINKEKVKLIGHGATCGIDLKHFSKDALNGTEIQFFLKKHKINVVNKKVLTYVGRITKDKGIEELIGVFERLFKENNQLILIMAGWDESTDIKDETLHQIHHHESIYYLGRINDVRPIYMITDVFMFPTYREGLPNSLLEASAMNLPIVSTFATGVIDIIEHNYNGVLVDVKNEYQLYLATKKLLDNFELSVALKSRTRNFVADRYDTDKVALDYKIEYDRIIDKILKVRKHVN